MERPSRPKRIRRLLGGAIILPFLLATGAKIEALRFARGVRRMVKHRRGPEKESTR